MIIEIEYFEGDTLLSGKRISKFLLDAQIKEIEKFYDRFEDNFIELLCRRFGWECIVHTNELPEYTYDRDIKRLYRNKV